VLLLENLWGSLVRGRKQNKLKALGRHNYRGHAGLKSREGNCLGKRRKGIAVGLAVAAHSFQLKSHTIRNMKLYKESDHEE